MLAIHDGIIRAVLAYWVDGTTVHYVTMDHEQKQTPLASLDRSLSERLNRERNVTFSLLGQPAKRSAQSARKNLDILLVVVEVRRHAQMAAPGCHEHAAPERAGQRGNIAILESRGDNR